jgi:drug/metabolite transporter (DMT)-like permease
MLVVVTACWGLAFPCTKSWQNGAAGCAAGAAVAGLTLVALRTSLALLLFAACRPRLVWGPSRREHSIGLLLGLTHSLVLGMQALGMASTTPARVGFLASLSAAWVPLLTLLVFGRRVGWVALLGVVSGLTGAFVLGSGEGWGEAPGQGECWALASSVVLAVELLLLDRLGKGAGAGHLTVGFLAGTCLPALACAVAGAACGPGVTAWLSWAGQTLQGPVVWRDLMLLALFPTVLATHWMGIYQPRVPADRAAVIFLLEAVFAAAFSILWGLDHLTLPLALGGALIVTGTLLVELPGKGQGGTTPQVCLRRAEQGQPGRFGPGVGLAGEAVAESVEGSPQFAHPHRGGEHGGGGDARVGPQYLRQVGGGAGQLVQVGEAVGGGHGVLSGDWCACGSWQIAGTVPYSGQPAPDRERAERWLGDSERQEVQVPGEIDLLLSWAPAT